MIADFTTASVSTRSKSARRASLLTGQGAFETVFRTGRRVEGSYLQLIVATGSGRAGFVIGRKALARAVDRNRVRRKLRELLRAQRPALAAYDIIVRMKRAANRVEQDAAVAEAARLLGTLNSARL